MRAAMVGGAAYAVGKRAERRQAQDEEQDARLEELEAEQYAPDTRTSGDTIAQLERLGQLRDAGVLTSAEFEVQKQKLLQGA
jgi:hypothetical protein